MSYIAGAVVLLVVVVVGAWFLYSSASSSSSGANVVYARIDTSKGSIEIELFPASAPDTVANFVNLSKSGFYNNLVWHRIVPGFVVQTGDPLTRNGVGNRSLWGTGQSSQQVPLEIKNSTLHNDAGYLAMAHTSTSTFATSQFYINLASNRQLDGQYTVFGKVVSGMDVISAIASVPVYTSQSSPYYDQPITPVYVLSITILSSGP
ncbi:MAG: peptidylprolyl isomerase [Nitrososphaerales archaeon]|nr:peptidylprolyl isomerase [Nitrososphaerales archaeon]